MMSAIFQLFYFLTRTIPVQRRGKVVYMYVICSCWIFQLQVTWFVTSKTSEAGTAYPSGAPEFGFVFVLLDL